MRVSSLVSIGPAAWPAIWNIDTDRQTDKHNAFYYIDCCSCIQLRIKHGDPWGRFELSECFLVIIIIIIVIKHTLTLFIARMSH